jgi:hypothetical protein
MIEFEPDRKKWEAWANKSDPKDIAAMIQKCKQLENERIRLEGERYMRNFWEWFERTKKR